MEWDMGECKTVYNLCDRSFNEILSKKHGIDTDMVQLGSYTCANYFTKVLDLAVDLKKEMFDLVVPVFHEHRLDIFESKKFIECCKRCRQVVVNDFGALEYLNGKHNIRLGRLLFKDYRDKRYEEYDFSEYHAKAKTVLDFVDSCGIRVAAYENDLITRNFRNDCGQSIELYLHYPYRQISMSHICEYASIGKNIEDKYIPDELCDMQCFHLNVRSMQYGYLKVGKAVYDILDEQYLENIENSSWLIITPRW